jgi:hypothetical protein
VNGLVGSQLVTKPKQFSVFLVLVTVLCLLWLLILSVSAKGLYLIELLDSTVGKSIIVASVALPFLGFRGLREKGAPDSDRIALAAACVASLIPLICILVTFVSAQFGPLPGHVYEKDTNKITIGMTRDQVTKSIGSPHGWTSDAHKERLMYHLQARWWGMSGQEFYVNLLDGRVLYSKAVHYGLEQIDGFFAPPGFSNLFESIQRQTNANSAQGRN